MAFKLAEAYVEISAKLSKFKKGLAGAHATLKKTMTSMAATAKKAAFVIGATLATMYTLSIRAAATQQEAEFKLAVALQNTGKATKKQFEELKKYASQLQKVTKHGDEGTLEIMRLGLSMGVTTDKIKEATKGAMGLAAAFNMDLSASMKLVALGLAGEYSMLGRYITSIRAASTETEKMALFQRAMADGFRIAKAEALVGLTPLEKMRNALSDILEVIGKPFLADLQKTATAITKWAEDNQDKIEGWADTFHKKVSGVWDVFKNWLKYMTIDFEGGMKIAMKSMIAIVSSAFDALVVIAEGPAKDIAIMFAKALKDAILESIPLFGQIGDFFESISDPTIAENVKKQQEYKKALREYKKTGGLAGPVRFTGLTTKKRLLDIHTELEKELQNIRGTTLSTADTKPTGPQRTAGLGHTRPMPGSDAYNEALMRRQTELLEDISDKLTPNPVGNVGVPQ